MKNHHGFTTIEVIVAMFILASSVYVLADVQVRSMFKILRDRELLQKIFILKKKTAEFVPLISKEFKPSKEKLEDMELTLRVESFEFPKKSLLRELLGEDLDCLRTTGEWKSGPFSYDVGFFVCSERERKKDETEK